jgi:hypothetical protein
LLVKQLLDSMLLKRPAFGKGAKRAGVLKRNSASFSLDTNLKQGQNSRTGTVAVLAFVD